MGVCWFFDSVWDFLMHCCSRRSDQGINIFVAQFDWVYSWTQRFCCWQVIEMENNWENTTYSMWNIIRFTTDKCVRPLGFIVQNIESKFLICAMKTCVFFSNIRRGDTRLKFELPLVGWLFIRRHPTLEPKDF